MQKKNFKGKCIKQKITKCDEVCRTYNDLTTAYLLVLEENDEIMEIRCNVLMGGLELGEYTTDFVCRKTNGDLAVMECVQRQHLLKPLTAKFLDASREYWMKRGVIDCMKRTVPKWIEVSQIDGFVECEEAELLEATNTVFAEMEEMTEKQIAVMNERYTMVSGLVAFVGNDVLRNEAIAVVEEGYKIGKQSIKKYLCDI